MFPCKPPLVPAITPANVVDPLVGLIVNVLVPPTTLSTLLRNRGLSSDTSIFAAFAIDAALKDIAAMGTIRAGSVRRIAVIGPGLDFTDKQEGYDFYPLQTIQPFAVVDSLRARELTDGSCAHAPPVQDGDGFRVEAGLLQCHAYRAYESRRPHTGGRITCPDRPDRLVGDHQAFKPAPWRLL